MALSGQGGQSDRRHIWERKRESLQSSLACFVIPDPILNSDPRPHQRSVMRGSCLTQNGAWFKSQKERDIHRVEKRERKRELHRTQRTHLSSLSLSLDCSFFSSSPFAFSFVFTAQKLLPFLPIRLLSFSPSFHPPSSHPRLVVFGQQHAIISGHHHRYGFRAARTSRILGGNL